jgi:hypothetical protein
MCLSDHQPQSKKQNHPKFCAQPKSPDSSSDLRCGLGQQESFQVVRSDSIHCAHERGPDRTPGHGRGGLPHPSPPLACGTGDRSTALGDPSEGRFNAKAPADRGQRAAVQTLAGVTMVTGCGGSSSPARGSVQLRSVCPAPAEPRLALERVPRAGPGLRARFHLRGAAGPGTGTVTGARTGRERSGDRD